MGRNKLALAVLRAHRLIAVRSTIVVITEFLSVTRKRFEISIDDRSIGSILI